MRPSLRAVLLLLLPAFLLASLALVTPARAATASPSRPAPAAQAAAVQAPDMSFKAAVALLRAQPVSYTVRHGDTLGKIAALEYGSGRAWPALWWVNKSQVKDPDSIYAGEHLKLSAWHPVLGWLLAAAQRAEGHSASPRTSSAALASVTAVSYSGGFPSQGTYSFSMLESIWEWAGGPSYDAWAAATIAECESGGRTSAYNPSGASGLWQILGVPFPGNPFDGPTNARMAVAKFRGAGGNFSPWVCRA